MTTLLVGATGFLGSAVAQRLVRRGAVALVRPSSDRALLPAEMDVRFGDLEDSGSVRIVLGGVETLVYCASMGFGHVPGLVRQMERTGVRRAVFISTTAIFTSLPARSRAVRLEAEQAVANSHLAWTILRPTMIYGSDRDRNISRLLRLLRRSPVYPVFGNGGALHQPIYLEDLADAVVAALDAQPTIGQAYNLAGAVPLTYAELVRAAGRAVGREVHLLRLPLPLALGAVHLARAARLPTPVSPEQIQRLAEDKAFDYAPAVRDFGFHTRPFEEGVRLEAEALGLAPSRGPRERWAA